jgi:hypothetical protein
VPAVVKNKCHLAAGLYKKIGVSYAFFGVRTDFQGYYALKMATPISGVFILLPV